MYALVIAGFPRIDRSGAEVAPWSDFRQAADLIEQNRPKAERLQQGVFVLPLDTELQTLCELERAARIHGVPLRVLFLADRPSFAMSQA
jgi:hypothetical protein